MIDESAGAKKPAGLQGVASLAAARSRHVVLAPRVQGAASAGAAAMRGAYRSARRDAAHEAHFPLLPKSQRRRSKGAKLACAPAFSDRPAARRKIGRSFWASANSLRAPGTPRSSCAALRCATPSFSRAPAFSAAAPHARQLAFSESGKVELRCRKISPGILPFSFIFLALKYWLGVRACVPLEARTRC